eukprot:GFKZ01003232.1.p1 GENE.GFKZ01003232.1~~GFKZ01003232.1.p1  ORF type:complete len:897 (-),score=123.99 GFKZ01003232.1:192-2738(-)
MSDYFEDQEEEVLDGGDGHLASSEGAAAVSHRSRSGVTRSSERELKRLSRNSIQPTSDRRTRKRKRSSRVHENAGNNNSGTVDEDEIVIEDGFIPVQFGESFVGQATNGVPGQGAAPRHLQTLKVHQQAHNVNGSTNGPHAADVIDKNAPVVEDILDMGDDTDEDVLLISDSRVDETSEIKDAKTHGAVPLGSKSKPSDDFSHDAILNVLKANVTKQRELVRDLHRMLTEATSNLRKLEEQMADRLSELRRAADEAYDWNGNTFPWDAILAQGLRQVFHIQSFRPLQREALNATLLGRDVFAILPTGAGKSLIYQLASVVDRGLTVVVTPLISLSADQKRGLMNLSIYAESLDSMSSKTSVKHIFDKVVPRKGHVQHSSHPRCKHQNPMKKIKGNGEPGASNAQRWVQDDMETTILFVTPEQLVRNKKLMSRLEMMYEMGHLSRVVIDEAHCCSSWGHDFRDDYRKLGIVKRQCPETPILALSATSCPDTTRDVCTILEIPNCVVFRGSIERANLYYEVRPKPDDEEKVIRLLASMIGTEFKRQCGIVYVLSRKETETYSRGLRQKGIACGCYHGDMTMAERAEVHEGWQRGKTLVVVATIAFGLGIDNLRVRFVIHATMATSIEGYYQESGRAGRNGKAAKCVVLHRAKDFARLSGFVAEKGDKRVRKMYDMYKYVTGRGLDRDGMVTRRCRREIIADGFGEVKAERKGAKKSSCCDICRGVGDGVVIDVTKLGRDVTRILAHQCMTRPDEKVTMLMLATTWGNRGEKGKRMRGEVEAIDRRVSLEARLEVIIELVFMGVFEEYHRYSSYAVNAYVKVGERAHEMLEEGARVLAVLRAADAGVINDL